MIGPGASALTLICWGPSWTAMDRVRAEMAPLLAAYASCGYVQPITARNELMFTTAPPPAAAMWGTAYFEHNAVPCRLTEVMNRQSSRSGSRTERSWCGMIPALLNRV